MFGKKDVYPGAVVLPNRSAGDSPLTFRMTAFNPRDVAAAPMASFSFLSQEVQQVLAQDWILTPHSFVRPARTVLRSYLPLYDLRLGVSLLARSPAMESVVVGVLLHSKWEE